jgi:hypothetical protein
MADSVVMFSMEPSTPNLGDVVITAGVRVEA